MAHSNRSISSGILIVLAKGLAIWLGDEYNLIFLFAISSRRGLTFTNELKLLSSSLVILFGFGSGLDVFQMSPHRQALTVDSKAKRPHSPTLEKVCGGLPADGLSSNFDINFNGCVSINI